VRSRHHVSAAARVFAIIVAASLLVSCAVAVVTITEAQRSERVRAEDLTGAVARSLAVTPSVVAAVDEPGATAELQPLATRIQESAGVAFVTIMDPGGTRITHPSPAEVGRPYVGTIPAAAVTLTEEYSGTLGPSVRTIAPIERDGELVGWIAVGRTVGSIEADLRNRIPTLLGFAAAFVVIGVLAAAVARRATRRFAGDLPAGRIRDAVAGYESVRTLGEALRAQTHEHGNRIHTAVSLLELGRVSEAKEILSATATQAQALVDQVAARRDGDPTIGALLLGKSAQARERGIDWDARVDPDAPRSALTPIDAVSVVGNLIDNALDAAASGPSPRWVHVAFARQEAGLLIAVSDSGPGIPAHLRDRVFDRGFSTKPADATGRGIGLALVRSIVDEAAGTIEISDDPTTVRVTLPRRSS
jgi:sensor histidine kinase regulating citrate/malate metabolism